MENGSLPDICPKDSQLTKTGANFEWSISSQKDVMDRSRMNFIHQNVGHPLFTSFHLLQNLQELISIEVVA